MKMSVDSINAYQDFCATTWVNHDHPEMQVPHAALGLTGEAGEVAELIKKAIRGDNDGVVDREKLTKELGDVAYYLVTLARLHGIDADEILWANVAKLTSRQQRGVLKGSGDER